MIAEARVDLVAGHEVVLRDGIALHLVVAPDLLFRVRDRQNEAALAACGRRVMTVWECALKGTARRPLPDVIASCSTFIRGPCSYAELSGLWREQPRPD